MDNSIRFHFSLCAANGTANIVADDKESIANRGNPKSLFLPIHANPN